MDIEVGRRFVGYEKREEWSGMVETERFVATV